MVVKHKPQKLRQACEVFLFFFFTWHQVHSQSVTVSPILDIADTNFGKLLINSNVTFDIDSAKILLADISKEEVSQMPSMAGRFESNKESLWFLPRYPFIAGRNYNLWITTNGQLINSRFSIEKTIAQPLPRIVSILPNLGQVPANILKVYIEFSAPIREGQVSKYISILDEHNELIPKVFLEMDLELWDHENRRLTLWFDPGRIKSGLIPNVKYGMPLQPNKNYTLKVSKELKDIYGNGLEDDFFRSFSTFANDYTQPDPERWTVTQINAGSLDTLRIYYNEKVDPITSKSNIRIRNKNGDVIAGNNQLSTSKKYVFVPSEKWLSGKYTIQINERLEDLAGNSIIRLFDTKIDNNSKGQTQAKSKYRTKRLGIYEIEFFVY